MQALLSFDKAPPFAAPLRFFVTAPLFAVAAGLLMVAVGPDILASRWSPATLALTHLITVGFLLQVMLGALIQILPVVAGANVAHPLLVARLVHGGLAAGTVVLVLSFLGLSPTGLAVAVGLVVASLAVFLGAAGRALFAVPSTSPTIHGLKLALVGLGGTIGLGAALALALGRGWNLPLVAMTDLHAGWGLGAWAGVLLVAMAYVVVPMFQLTPGYPARFSWWLPSLLALLLLAWSGAVLVGEAVPARLCVGLVALLGMGFAGFTLRLQRRRRRARSDATYRYWQGGLCCALAALAMVVAAALWPPLAEWPGWALLFGVLFGVGGFMSFIVGMLYKIVPFLSWLHLQNLGQGKVAAPNMSKILGEQTMQRQMWAHFAALALLLLAVFVPDWLVRPAGVALALANLGLFANLWRAIGRYRRHEVEIRALAAPGAGYGAP